MFAMAIIETFIGVLLLCASMTKHYRQIWYRAPSPTMQMSLRVFGWGILALALGGFIASEGIAIALVTFFGVLGVTIVAVALLMTYWNQQGSPFNS